MPRRSLVARSVLVMFVTAACSTPAPVTTPQPVPVATAVVNPPLSYTPQPTTAEITPADMMSRLYPLADDSMRGREAGTIGNVRGTNFIAASAQRIGLEPAGENGTFFQTIPMVTRAFDSTRTTLSVGGTALVFGSDYVAIPQYGTVLPFGDSLVVSNIPVVFGGQLGNPAKLIDPSQAAGKIVVFQPPLGPDNLPSYRFWGVGGLSRYASAKAIVVPTLDMTPGSTMAFFRDAQSELMSQPAEAAGPAPVGIIVTPRVASMLLGGDPAAMKVGALGKLVTASVIRAVVPSPYPARNVVAILRGSDPTLRGEYVAIGAHNDHIGMAATPVDHDSLRAFNTVLRPMGEDSPQPRAITPEQWTQIRAMIDSLRRLHPTRLDSVYNGADDDGTGSSSVLEIAEALAKGPVRPKRSILFVWHTAEEKGLYGSEYFTDHPTVPRDSIVTQLNIDMIGRGGPQDIEHGGMGYLQLIGSRRLSTELGDLVDRVNRTGAHGFNFDYQFDANGHPEQYYCRSDHYNYARYGIPITFFSTGGHRDYHQLTDEPEYIDFVHLARVANLVRDVALTVANLDHRVKVDKPKPDPHGQCVQ